MVVVVVVVDVMTVMITAIESSEGNKARLLSCGLLLLVGGLHLRRIGSLRFPRRTWKDGNAYDAKPKERGAT